ncbi:glycoside hydrolase family 2 protein [Mucilaginibacter boryungensis]|nr:glycoside hydrolase family 2 TIM barrel-domain containing protein [Mucilaginibacter boryungensis]
MGKKLLFIYILISALMIARIRVYAQDRNPDGSIPLNDNWSFYFTYDVRPKPNLSKVTLPHTWNANEAKAGKMNYTRQSGTYIKKLFLKPEWANKRVFLYFEGANSVADVFINQKFTGEHKGGYTRFCFEITDQLVFNQENTITVQVSNAYRMDVLPLSGDFNVYGGIHRPVALLIKEKNCISPLDHASSGVYFVQKRVSKQSAAVEAQVKLSLKGHHQGLKLRTTLFTNAGAKVLTKTTDITNDSVAYQQLLIDKPHLWNGKEDPYLYHARVELLDGNRVSDSVNEEIGFRYFSVDAQNGFFLNGKYLDLHGLGRHEDVEGKGSALTAADEDTDINLIKKIGATALRLTHYPQGKYFYELCDRNGLIVWTEIPLVGPGGYTGPGYIANPLLQQHAKDVLVELIRQNYNHPSICFWGLFNELKLDYDDPIPFLTALKKVAKKEDPTRLTTCASFLDNDSFNEVTDLIAWNKYYGWYGGVPDDLGKWADKMHRKYPLKPIAVSEYGAGASPYKHAYPLVRPSAGGKFHPEEWQTLFHEKNWEQLNTRKYIWGKFIWVLADFGSAIRDEGDDNGINDKGLVTYDRKIVKDAFYFYKANWNTEPMVYITERRFTDRTVTATAIKVYTNFPDAELFLNGVSFGRKSADSLHRVIWDNILLKNGSNTVRVVAQNQNVKLEDSCIWMLK